MFYIFIYILIHYMILVNSFNFLEQLSLNDRSTNQLSGESRMYPCIKSEICPIDNTTCYGMLGCVSITEEWYHRLYRPNNLVPLDRHTIKTEFNIVNQSPSNSNVVNLDFVHITNGSEMQTASNKSILAILIHDFTSNGYTGWIKHLAATYIIKKEITVMSVDWQAGAEPPYEQAIANARVVALEILAFLNSVEKKPYKNVVLVGHGVGAHIAGYVGQSYRVNKIIGLDPTGPYFENMPAIVRLDPTDARWVEVIHTDAYTGKSQGTLTVMGHVDFFVNGANLQPHCNETSHTPKFTKLDRNSLKEGAILPACSHKRSFKYYIEAVQNLECEFIGFECGSYKDFLEGKCTDCISANAAACEKIGAEKRVGKKNGSKYYLRTADTSPFCMNPYKILIYFDEKQHGKSDRTGKFELMIINGKGTITTAHPSSESPKSFETSSPYIMIYYARKPVVTNAVEIKLKWINNPNSLCLFCNTAVYVKKVQIQLVSISKQGQYGLDNMCPVQSRAEMKSGSFVSFFKCKETLETASKASKKLR